MTLRKALDNLVIVALYTILASILTYPLLLRFTSHVPGTDIWAFDEYTFLWNTWWFKHSLLDLHTNPLYSGYIFYPVGISLVLYTYNLFNAILSLPLQPFLNLATISNLTIILAMVLSGYGVYLLVLHLLREEKSLPSRAAAFTAGALYAFGSYRFVYAALGHYDMVSTEWIPFYALFLIKTVEEKKLSNALLAGLFFTLALLSEMIFGIFMVFLALIYVPLAGRQKIANLAFWGRMGLLAATVVILYIPIGYPVMRELLSYDYALQGWGDSDRLAVDLFGFITPTNLHPILGGDFREELTMVREGRARFSDVNTVYLGWVAIALALFASLKYWHKLKAWAISAMTFAVLSMGPLLHINGRFAFDLDGLQVNLPLPFILLHYLPVVKANRVPNRFSVVLMLALSVLVGYAVYTLLRNLKGKSALILGTATLSALILFEHLSIPLPLTDARVPSFYYSLAQETGDFAILELPLGWRNSFGVLGAESTQIQYYQSVHQKRLLGGNISRNPPFKFEYFRRLPIIDSITALESYENVDQTQREQDKALVPDFVYFFDIHYIVLHPGIPGRPPWVDVRPAVEDYITEVFPVEKFLEEDGLVVYTVEQPAPPSELTIDFGADGALMYQGEGWSWSEALDGASANWATSQEARFFFPLREVRDHRLVMRTKAFSYQNSPKQTVSLSVNGHAMGGPREVGPSWTQLEYDIPASVLRSGLNEAALRFAYLASPHDVLPANFAVGNTGIISPVEMDVNSAGLNAGDFAYITIDGVDASTHRRGYNLAVIDPHTGKVGEKAGFDTWANEFESQAMAQFLASIPDGMIVVAVVKGDGAKSLTAEAVEALESIGAKGDLRGTEGLSHAIIGVKGSPQGTALEAWGQGNSYLHIGRNPDERTLSLALDWVSISAK